MFDTTALLAERNALIAEREQLKAQIEQLKSINETLLGRLRYIETQQRCGLRHDD